MAQYYIQLTLEDRCSIARLHEGGQSIRQIAAALDRSPSTVSRELKRNRGATIGYRPAYADQQARARRWTGSRLERDHALRTLILGRLESGWSPEQFEAMSNGALDMSVYPLAYSGGKLPQTNLTLMPALIENYQQAYGWETADIGKWLVDYLAQHGVVIVTWIWQGGGVASRDKAILVPADLKGLKTRGAGKMIELMLEAAGGSISNFASTETYNAMHSGVVDALWTSSASLMSFRLQEVAKYVTTARKYTFWYMFEPLLMSKTTYDKLTPAQQKIVMDVGKSLQPYALDSCKADDQEVADVFAKAGDHVDDMNAQQFQQWKALAQQSAWKDFAKQVKDGQKLLDMATAVA